MPHKKEKTSAKINDTYFLPATTIEFNRIASYIFLSIFTLLDLKYIAHFITSISIDNYRTIRERRKPPVCTLLSFPPCDNNVTTELEKKARI